MKPIHAAYLAGLVDGEGCLQVVENKAQVNRSGYLCSPRFIARVDITNTSARMMDWIQGHVKGLVVIKQRAGQWKSTKTCYRWVLSMGQAVKFLRIIHPYLVIKKDQADLVFKLKRIQMSRDPKITGHAPARLTDEELAERRGIISDLKAAKKFQGDLLPRNLQHEITASPIEWAYLAGIFDGEGCVRSYECKRHKGSKFSRFRISVRISNTSEHLINWVIERFGGFIHLDRKPGQGLATRNMWSIIWSPGKGEALLHGMHPYLTVKKAQAELAFRLRTLVRSKCSRIVGFAPGQTLDAETISARRKLVQEMKLAKSTQ